MAPQGDPYLLELNDFAREDMLLEELQRFEMDELADFDAIDSSDMLMNLERRKKPPKGLFGQSDFVSDA